MSIKQRLAGRQFLKLIGAGGSAALLAACGGTPEAAGTGYRRQRHAQELQLVHDLEHVHEEAPAPEGPGMDALAARRA